MHRAALRITSLAAIAAALGAFSLAPAPASALTVQYKFTNWAVWGSLTPKKLNEPITLPPGSTFNGLGDLTTTQTEISGTVEGNIVVPPFNAPLKVYGVPTSVGATFTQVGPTAGTITQAPPADCMGSHFGGPCVTLSVNSKDEVGVTALGILGIDIPTHCEITEPVTLALKDTLPLAQLLDEGSRFTGSTNIPPINCGLSGLLLSPVLTLLMSGPENSYSLHIGPEEPTAPTVATEPASSVSQISADLHATVDPKGEAETGCELEYGESTSYGASVPCAWAPGSGFSVHAPVTGLDESTTYHYRVVASNALGTSYGADQSFTTLSGAPEYGQCVAQKHGNYADPNCQDVAEKKGVPDHRGGYEWVPGPARTCVAEKKGEYTDSGCTTKSAKPHKGTYEKAPGPGYTSSSGPATLQVPGLERTVVCSASTGAGEVTGLSTATDRVTFTGCESAGKKCTSEGPNGTPSGKAGVIVTNLLDARLLGPVSDQVWTEFASAEHRPYTAEFGCEGSLLRTSGSVAGVQAGDVGVLSLTSTTTFAAEEGEQALLSALSSNGGKSWSEPELSSLVTLASNSSAAPTEIKP